MHWEQLCMNRFAKLSVNTSVDPLANVLSSEYFRQTHLVNGKSQCFDPRPDVFPQRLLVQGMMSPFLTESLSDPHLSHSARAVRCVLVAARPAW